MAKTYQMTLLITTDEETNDFRCIINDEGELVVYPVNDEAMICAATLTEPKKLAFVYKPTQEEEEEENA